MENKNYAPASLGRMLVLGLGKSGRAAVDYLVPLIGTRVARLCVAAGAQTAAAEEEAAKLRAAGAVVVFGDDAVPTLADLAGGTFDLCIASPGIPPRSDLYTGALEASAEVVSEVEFAWREADADARWVAITGTNGKTTVTALTEHLLRTAGVDARAVGNIGDPCLAAVAAGGAQVYVAETSSFQLESTSRFAPTVAALLNITPDHLSWHGSLEAYAAAKDKVLSNLPTTPGGVAVLCATDEAVRARVRALKKLSPEERGFAYVPVGTAAGIRGDMRAACGSENAAFVAADGTLTVALRGTEYALVRADELLIKGEHNVENALAAASCALAMGADPARVAEGLRTFAPLEHRIEPCGTVRGAACYNDSKATNVDATLKAFAAFDPVRPIVLLGGRDKGTDLAPLVEAAHAHAKAVVCFGESRERFLAAFGGTAAAPAPGDASALAVLAADHLEDALDAALALAGEGDVVLLSPACASFDEFSCYEERGDAFKRLVASRAEGLRTA